MGQFFSLKNSKFFSGLKKLPHSAYHYYLRQNMLEIFICFKAIQPELNYFDLYFWLKCHIGNYCTKYKVPLSKNTTVRQIRSHSGDLHPSL